MSAQIKHFCHCLPSWTTGYIRSQKVMIKSSWALSKALAYLWLQGTLVKMAASKVLPVHCPCVWTKPITSATTLTWFQKTACRERQLLSEDWFAGYLHRVAVWFEELHSSSMARALVQATSLSSLDSLIAFFLLLLNYHLFFYLTPGWFLKHLYQLLLTTPLRFSMALPMQTYMALSPLPFAALRQLALTSFLWRANVVSALSLLQPVSPLLPHQLLHRGLFFPHSVLSPSVPFPRRPSLWHPVSTHSCILYNVYYHHFLVSFPERKHNHHDYKDICP